MNMHDYWTHLEKLSAPKPILRKGVAFRKRFHKHFNGFSVDHLEMYFLYGDPLIVWNGSFISVRNPEAKASQWRIHDELPSLKNPDPTLAEVVGQFIPTCKGNIVAKYRL